MTPSLRENTDYRSAVVKAFELAVCASDLPVSVTPDQSGIAHFVGNRRYFCRKVITASESRRNAVEEKSSLRP
jgi:hypothetical protein